MKMLVLLQVSSEKHKELLPMLKNIKVVKNEKPKTPEEELDGIAAAVKGSEWQ